MDGKKKSGRLRPELTEDQLKSEIVQVMVTPSFKKRLREYCEHRGLGHAEFIRVTLAEKMCEAKS